MTQREQPDISLAKEKLQGWSQNTVKEGLITTIAYFDDLLKNQNK
jgi:hypothetical protein